MKNLISQIKKTIIFLGDFNDKGEPRIHATSFMVSIDNVYHLVTAKHVVMEMKNGKWGSGQDKHLITKDM